MACILYIGGTLYSETHDNKNETMLNDSTKTLY